jgi:hypothetical protein
MMSVEFKQHFCNFKVVAGSVLLAAKSNALICKNCLPNYTFLQEGIAPCYNLVFYFDATTLVLHVQPNKYTNNSQDRISHDREKKQQLLLAAYDCTYLVEFPFIIKAEIKRQQGRIIEQRTIE